MENGAYRGDKIWNPKGTYNDTDAVQSYNLSLQPQQIKRARSLSTLVAAIVSKETPHNAEPMMFIGEHDELCIAVYFKCFNLEGKKNSTTNCEKEIPQRGNIESQYQNKPTYWTAGKRARARHYSLQVRNRRIFGLLVKIDEGEKPLFCTSHDGPTRTVSF